MSVFFIGFNFPFASLQTTLIHTNTLLEQKGNQFLSTASFYHFCFDYLQERDTVQLLQGISAA